MAETGIRPRPQRRKPIRVLIADDSDRIRRGLSGLFELVDDVEIVAEALNGAQAIELAAKHNPDVVLMDVAMPVMGGIEATRILAARQPMIRVLMVTALPGQEEAALQAGSGGFLLKDADPEEIIRAVRSLT